MSLPCSTTLLTSPERPSPGRDYRPTRVLFAPRPLTALLSAACLFSAPPTPAAVPSPAEVDRAAQTGASSASSTSTPSASASSASTKSDETIELSPFVIVAENEKGWVATHSLAGSRLNTELKDIATSLEVLTKDFMDDFGLATFEEAALYTTNVEGIREGFESADGEGLAFGSGYPPPNRIRGLDSPTLSRGFFKTVLPSDNYNVDRITVASGPNNLLFGTGSPGGVVDSSISRATFKNSARFGMRFDSNGSKRYTLDLNRQIIPRRLAFRLAALHEEKDFPYKPSGADDKRLYGAVQFQPWSKTSISVNYERASINQIRPQLQLPFDEVTPWFNSSQLYPGTVDRPIYNNQPISGAFPAATLNGTVFAQATNNNNQYPTLVGGNAQGYSAGQFYNFRNYARIKSPTAVPGGSNFGESTGYTFLDGSVIPLDVDVGGLSRRERIKSDIGNLFVTQQVGRHLSFELAAQREKFRAGFAQMGSNADGYTVGLDPNRYLPDGVTPNPNLGKLYIDADGGGAGVRHILTDTGRWRLSGSYEFNFERGSKAWWRKLLGVQRLAGLYSEDREETRSGFVRFRLLPQNGVDPVFTGLPLTPQTTNNWAVNAFRSIQFRYYLDPARGDYSPRFPFDRYSPFSYTDSTGRKFTADPLNTGFINAEGQRLGAFNPAAGNKSIQRTGQIAYQGFFWDNRLALTTGFRRDQINSAALTAMSLGQDNAGAGPNRGNTGLYVVPQDLRFLPFNDADKETGDTITRGFVVRPLQGWVKLPLRSDISLTYNRSETFQPNTTLLSPFGDRYPGARGDSVDKGVRLGIFEGKFSINYVKFQTTATPVASANDPFQRFRTTLAVFFERVHALYFGTGQESTSLAFAQGRTTNPKGWMALANGANGGDYRLMSDRVSAGDEISANWRVTKNFQVRFNLNRQESKESRVASDWFRWIAQEIPEYKKLTYPAGSPTSPAGTWDTALISNGTTPFSETIAAQYERTVVNGLTGLRNIQSLDGKSNDAVRANRYNLITKYTVDEGILKGLSIGGAWRHRARPFLNYGSALSTGSPDLRIPFYGKKEDLFDLSFNYSHKLSLLLAKRMRVGLNIRNILDEDGLVVKRVSFNGAPVRLARVSEPRIFILNVDFDF